MALSISCTKFPEHFSQKSLKVAQNVLTLLKKLLLFTKTARRLLNYDNVILCLLSPCFHAVKSHCSR